MSERNLKDNVGQIHDTEAGMFCVSERREVSTTAWRYCVVIFYPPVERFRNAK
jgi:hypothetical protein